MSSPLVFVRDGRTLPFVPVTLAALAAIREHTPKRRPYAIATYMALLEFANEDRADRVAISQRDLVERVGAARTTVQTALGDLRAAGVLQVVERIHGNARVENEYVIVEPATSDTPARDTGDPRPSGEQRTLEERKEEQPDVSARTREAVKFNGKVVDPGLLHDANDALRHYGLGARQSLAPLDGTGRPTESLKRIIGAMLSYPSLRTNYKRVIDCTLRSAWWGDGPPSVGVVFGPSVVEREIARAQSRVVSLNGRRQRNGRSGVSSPDDYSHLFESSGDAPA